MHEHAGLVARLDQRLIDAVTLLEAHLKDFATQKERIDAARVELQDRVADARSGLDQRCESASAHQQSVERTMAAAEERLALRMSEFDRQLDCRDAMVRELEARASAAGLDLDRRLLTFEAQRGVIESAIATAQQATAGLSELDRRVVDLTTHETGALARAEAQVGRLEERAAAATVDLTRLAHARDELQHELTHLHADVKKARNAAENDARKVEQLRKQTADLRAELGGFSTPTSPLASSLPRRTHRIERLRQLFLRGVLLLVALLAVTAISALSVRAVRRVETPTRVNEPGPPTLATAPTPPASPLLTVVRETAPPPVPEGGPTAIVPERRLPAPAMPAEPEAPAATVQPLVGSLSIDSDPSGATVFVNRRAVGETPLMLDSLRIGSHVIRLELANYQPWTAAVQVSAIQQTRVRASLTK